MKFAKTWAYVLIVLGLVFLINSLLDLDYNLFVITIALGMIYIGYSLVKGQSWNDVSGESAIFAKVDSSAGNKDATFHTIFAERTLRLDEIHEAGHRLRLNTIFGETKVILPKDLPIRIEASAFFAECVLPSGKEVHFGEEEYQNNPDGLSAVLHLDSFTLFGETTFIRV